MKKLIPFIITILMLSIAVSANPHDVVYEHGSTYDLSKLNKHGIAVNGPFWDPGLNFLAKKVGGEGRLIRSKEYGALYYARNYYGGYPHHAYHNYPYYKYGGPSYHGGHNYPLYYGYGHGHYKSFNGCHSTSAGHGYGQNTFHDCGRPRFVH